MMEMMKLKKLGIFLSAVAAVLALTCSVYASESTVFEQNTAFLHGLGITDREALSDSGVVSRGKFTDMVIRAMNIAPSETEKIFADVTNKTLFAPAITEAAHLGIITGNGTGTFNPDEAIEPGAAVKICVAALGYNKMAYAYGGYPMGYTAIAGELKLTSNVNISGKELTGKDAAQLIYNFLNSDICEITAVKGDEIKQARSHGKSPLTEYFNLKKIRGIMKAANGKSMLYDTGNIIGKINIDGKAFKSDARYISDSFGCLVTAWYNDSETVKHIITEKSNRIVEIKAEDVDRVEGSRLYTFENNNKKIYSLNPALTFVKNGRSIEYTDSDFVFPDGIIRLVDNDNDGKYDVADVSEYNYFVVTSVDAYGKKLYDSKSGSMLDLSEENEKYKSVMLTDKNGSLSETAPYDIASDTVLRVTESDDGEYISAVAVRKNVSGTVTEISQDTIKIDGQEYFINSYFKKHEIITAGYKYTFLLSDTDEIIALSSVSSDSMKYGYFYGYNRKTSGLNNDIKIAVLSAQGEYLYLSVADKVIFDGIMMRKTDPRIESALWNGTHPIYQLIRYELSGDGKVHKIDTATDAVGDVTDKYKNIVYTDDSLTRQFGNTAAYWHRDYNVFLPNILYSSKTIIISVPEKVTNSDGSQIPEEQFRVVMPAELRAAGKYNIDAYDMNADMIPGVIVIYDTETGNSSAVRTSTAMSLVEGLSKGINGDGETVYFVDVWRAGKYCRYTMTADFYDEKKAAGKLPSPGDAVRIQADSKNKITALSVDARYNKNYNDKNFIVLLTEQAPASSQADYNMFTGTVYSHTPTTLAIRVNDTKTVANSSYSAEARDGIAAFSITSSTRVVIYNGKTGIASQGKIDMLTDEVSAGIENASKIALKSYTHSVQTIIIYK